MTNIKRKLKPKLKPKRKKRRKGNIVSNKSQMLFSLVTINYVKVWGWHHKLFNYIQRYHILLFCNELSVYLLFQSSPWHLLRAEDYWLVCLLVWTRHSHDSVLYVLAWNTTRCNICPSRELNLNYISWHLFYSVYRYLFGCTGLFNDSQLEDLLYRRRAFIIVSYCDVDIIIVLLVYMFLVYYVCWVASIDGFSFLVARHLNCNQLCVVFSKMLLLFLLLLLISKCQILLSEESMHFI